MDTSLRKDRFRYFIFGLLAAFGLLLLAGAVDTAPNNFAPPHYGRYQIASWSSDLGDKGGGFGVFIADTATGETKLVYSRVFGEIGNGEIKKDDLGKPFSGIR